MLHLANWFEIQGFCALLAHIDDTMFQASRKRIKLFVGGSDEFEIHRVRNSGISQDCKNSWNDVMYGMYIMKTFSSIRVETRLFKFPVIK